MVPEPGAEAPTKAKPRVAVQANGLPEGVKILPVAGGPTSEASPPTASAPDPLPIPSVVPHKAISVRSIVPARARMGHTGSEAEAPTSAATPTKRRKPGRPKAGKLDVPRVVASIAPAVAPSLPAAPKIAPPPSPESTQTIITSSAPAGGARRLSDIAPRRPEAKPAPIEEPKPAPKPTEKRAKKPHRSRPHVHKVGIPPLHYGPIIAFSLRARARPHLVGLAALGAISLGVASAYGAWLLLDRGVGKLASGVIQAGPKLIVEAVLLALIYYIGRSIGQTAIIYGIAREADQRPVTISRQLGIAINTFGRRLILDLSYATAELALIAIGAGLLISGGEAWPMDQNLQIGLIFAAFLVLLYGLSALALSRGIAGVNLTLTTHKPRTAAKVGWELFSHRIELIGPRFSALLLELLLSLPLAALAIAFIIAAPASLRPLVIVGVGLLAWLAGALLGVGTAAWWSMLYRQLVLADRPGAVVTLLSSRQPEDARRGPLALVVALSTLIITASLVLPWLNLSI